MSDGSFDEALKQTMAMYGYKMGDYEAMLWLALEQEFGADALKRFLVEHAFSSEFAPKPANAAKALRPVAGAGLVLNNVASQMKAVGPYATPVFDDVTTETIHRLGGWVELAKILPDPTDAVKYEQFTKRFAAVYEAVKGSKMRGELEAGVLPLTNLCQIGADKPRQLLLEEGKR